jgi:hypothetical protein
VKSLAFLLFTVRIVQKYHAYILLLSGSSAKCLNELRTLGRSTGLCLTRGDSTEGICDMACLKEKKRGRKLSNPEIKLQIFSPGGWFLGTFC